MANVMKFSSDKIDVFLILVDSSGSMSEQEYNVIEGLKLFKKSFEKFPNASSIAVSVSNFDDSFYPCSFELIKDFKIKYKTRGATALYYSIVEGAKFLTDYMNEIAREKKCVPKATFLVLSDGEPCQDKANSKDAKKAISQLNNMGVTTAFVAFKEAISSDFGRALGFNATIDIKDKNALTQFFGVELSNSCKEQSNSVTPLGAEFFSKGLNGNSEEFSNATAQILEDDSWLDEI